MDLTEVNPQGVKFPGTCGHKMVKCGDNIYIFGGFSALYLDMDTVYFHVYNIPTNTMRNIEVEVNIPYYLVGFSMLYYKDCLYMILGLNNNLMIYDLKTQKMKKQFIGGPDENYAQTSVIIEDKVVTFGGINYVNLQLSNETFVLDLETLSWENITYQCTGDIPSPRNYHSAVYWNNKKYIFGGIGGKPIYTNIYRFTGGKHFSEIYSFDLSTKTWELVKPKMNIEPHRRRSHSTCVLNDKMYIFGGHFEQNNVELSFNDCWFYDFYLNSWNEVKLQNSFSPRRFHSTISYDGEVWLLGGIEVHNGLFNLHNDIFHFTEKKSKSKNSIHQNLLEINDNLLYIDTEIKFFN